MAKTTLMEEDWSFVLSLLPKRWRLLAQLTDATKGLRKLKEPGDALRVLFLHLACGLSLQETATQVPALDLGSFTNQSVLNRLRKSLQWLQELCLELVQEMGQWVAPPVGQGARALRLLLIDATLIRAPGHLGQDQRVHYCLHWPQLLCHHLKLTPAKGAGTGESRTHFPLTKGDHALADRGYSNYPSLQYAQAQGADVTVRLQPNAVRLRRRTPAGLVGRRERSQPRRFGLRHNLRQLNRPGRAASWPVWLTNARGDAPLAGRVCALRKSAAATAQAQAKARDKARRNQSRVRSSTLFYAQYVLIFTTVPEEELSAAEILEIYRLRWQIELTFKRFKQLAQLGRLPKEDPVSTQAWLYGKLLVALLTERLLQEASFSPWGYDWKRAATEQSLA